MATQSNTDSARGQHFIVFGRVQGVYFRASTREKAVALDLTGWTRNLLDGSVEVVAFGPFDKIAQLHAWLQNGPPRARVDRVDSGKLGQNKSQSVPKIFEIRD